MKYRLAMTIVLMFVSGLLMASCNEDEDCDCEEDAGASDDDAGDDDADDDAVDDDDAGDDDNLGTTPGAQECLDALKTPFQACKAACDEEEEFCVLYHCYAGCFVDLFDGAVACAAVYPELSGMVDYWSCNAECERGFRECVEPLAECDFDIGMICMDTQLTCESECVPESAL